MTTGRKEGTIRF